MNRRGKVHEWLLFGACAFVLTEAIISMILILDSGDPPSEGNALWRMILAVLYLGVAVILLQHYRETLLVVRRNWVLAALILFALVSSSWSARPPLVLQRGVAVLGTTLFGIALAVCLSLEEQLRLLSRLFRFIAVLSIGCVLLLPSYGISDSAENHGEWRGVFSNKNGLGVAMALSILVECQLPARSRLSKIVKYGFLLLSTVLLVFSDSVTSMFALVGALLSIQIYKFAAQRLRIPLYAIALGVLLIIASSVTVLRLNAGGITSVLGRSSDLTGRTDIWGLVMPYIFERPVLGYGYSGFWLGITPESGAIDRVMGGVVSYSHNGFLEVLLSLGAVGLLLALGFLWKGLRRAYSWSQRRRSSTDLWPLAFLFFFLLYNLTECTILLQSLEWALCVATIVGTDAAMYAHEEQQEEEFLLVPAEETI